MTRFLYEGDNVVLEVNAAGTEKARNIYGNNLIQRKAQGQLLKYFYNGHGDVTALVDDTGTIAATYYYDSFGNMLEETGTAKNPYRYRGYEYDKEIGQYYLKSRYYNPEIGRFMSEDSYMGDRKDPLSLNLYTYCYNEPIMYSDPSGHSREITMEVGGPTTNTAENIREELKKEKDPEERKRLKALYDKYVEYEMRHDIWARGQGIQIGEDIVNDKNNNQGMDEVLKNIGLGILSGVAENSIDSFNTINTILWSMTNIDAATKAYLSIAKTKEELIKRIEKLVTSDVAYYGAKLVTDAVFFTGGVIATVDGLVKILTGFGIDVASLGVELGTGGVATPVAVITTSAGLALAAVGALESGIGLSIIGNAFKNGQDDLANFKMAIAKGAAETVGEPLANGAFKNGDRLPNDATVVRGGESKPGDLQKNQAKDTTSNTLSANGGQGVSNKTLSNGMPQNSITECNVGDLRAKGYDVIASPTKDNPYHVSIITPGGKVLTDTEAANLSSIFTKIKNPSK